VEKADADLVKVLEGPTSIMFAHVAKAPAVLIKEFRKNSDKPVLKAAFAEATSFTSLSKHLRRRAAVCSALSDSMSAM